MSDIVKHDMIRNDMLPGTLRPPCPRYLPHVHSPSASQLPWRTEALLVGCWGKTILPQQHEAAQGLSTVPSVLSAVHRLVWLVFVVSTKTMETPRCQTSNCRRSLFSWFKASDSGKWSCFFHRGVHYTMIMFMQHNQHIAFNLHVDIMIAYPGRLLLKKQLN